MLFEHHTYLVQRRYRASGYTGSLAAAEYGRLAVWEHSPLFWALSATSTAAGRCISTGAPPRPLTSFRFLLFVVFVRHAYPAFVLVLHPHFPPKPRSDRYFLFSFLGFVFFRSYELFIYNHSCTRYVLQYYHTPSEYEYVSL